jgi:hypothetical protein
MHAGTFVFSLTPSIRNVRPWNAFVDEMASISDTLHFLFNRRFAMIKPNMPNMPGMGAMTDTLDFMKNMWSGMGMPGTNAPGMSTPGMIMPSLSVEEINKKITDLKAVESWLALNMTMLRSSIQALEVQAATIATLQSMGESFTATMQSAAKEAPAARETPTHKSPPPSSPNGAGASSASTAADGHEKMQGAPAPTSNDESTAASLTAPLVNAAAWWNVLQDQFKQAVSNAMASEPAASPPPAAKSSSKTKPPAAAAKTAATTKPATATRKRKPAK